MEHIETEVLIVGAGPTGASAAVMLARHGIDTTVISRSRWVADSPRAHIMNQRTMEVLRSIGVGEECETQSVPAHQMANHVMMTAVNGREFGRLWTWGNDPERAGEYAHSPVLGCDLPQDRLEPILIGEAQRLGARVRYRTEFIDLEQDADGVTTTARNRDTGAELSIRAQYVIGADGGQSPVAAALGLPLRGESGIAPALNVRFRADLTRYFEQRPGSIFWILQPDREGAMGNAMLRMVRPWTEWVVGFVHLGESVAALSEDEVLAQVRQIIRDDSVDVEILGVYPWRINHVIAEEYGRGRVFCAGDAVHRHPPMNGLGGNTCIQDAFNLSWKLAATLRWGAGSDLLDSYQSERQPVGERVVDAAIAGWRQNPDVVRSLGIDSSAHPEERQAAFEVLFEDTDAGEARRRSFDLARKSKVHSYHAHGTEMNQIYSSSAVLDNGLPPISYEKDPGLYYQPVARPGARVPHCWVEHRGHRVSTLDLCGPERFTLLTRARGRAWIDAAREIQAESTTPLATFEIGLGRQVHDLYGDWADKSELTESGAMLVRPDQHIAWMVDAAPGDATRALRAALDACLSRS